MPSLDQLLKSRPVLLADGATGTNLFGMGLQSGDPPEVWNDIHPDRITALHRGFVEAGADIILTNSFGGNARRLMLHRLESRVHELNRLAAGIARRVADEAGRPVVVAGSVGPTGDLFTPLGQLTADDARDVFRDQIEGLRDGGADVVWIETMSASEEIAAAAEAAVACGMPYALTASFDTAGRTMMGLTPAELMTFSTGLRPQPSAIGANCGVGASDLMVSILSMRMQNPDMAVIAKANAGIPQVHGAHVHYSGSPTLMADYARLAIDAGARIIGGCCGTTPEHLAAMRHAIDTHRPGARPDLDAVVQRLGPLAAPPPSAEKLSAARRPARRRS